MWIVYAMSVFSTLENEKFRELLWLFKPRYTPPGRTAIALHSQER
jgi:hypothetical protein